MIRLALFPLLATLLLLFSACPAFSGPFGPGTGSKTRSEPALSEQSTRPPEAPGPVAALLQQVVKAQKMLRGMMSERARILREHPFGASFWGFLGLALVYGMIHAVGPGHGKTVVSAYCLARPGRPAQAMLMGLTLSATHVGSATLLVGLAWLLLAHNLAGFEAAGIWLERASYALLLVLGTALLIGACRRFARNTHNTPAPEPAENLRQMLTTAFVTGLIPCPGATLILVFAFGLGIPGTGLLSMFFLALGMGLTTGLFGMAASGAGGAALATAGADNKRGELFHALLSLAGAATILIFGAVMLLGSLA
ncbi:MAG: nickel/cobalt transporter [Desulfovibrio sp.]